MVTSKKLEEFHKKHPRTAVCYRYIKGHIMSVGSVNTAYILIFNTEKEEINELYVKNSDGTIKLLNSSKNLLMPIFYSLDEDEIEYNFSGCTFTHRLVKHSIKDIELFINSDIRRFGP